MPRRAPPHASNAAPWQLSSASCSSAGALAPAQADACWGREVPRPGRGGRKREPSGGPGVLALAGGACDDQEAQAVAPDDDLIAVFERLPFDSVAVHDHAVEAAVVEHPDAIGLAHDQGMAPGDRGIVEAHVGSEAAPDAGPLARQRHDPRLAAVLVAEILARLLDLLARLGDELLGATFWLRERAAMAQRLLVFVLFAVGGRRFEQLSAREVAAAALGAVGQLVQRAQREHVAALATAKRSGAHNGAGDRKLHIGGSPLLLGPRREFAATRRTTGRGYHNKFGSSQAPRRSTPSARRL